jgi:peptide methionine sulfoxide reductase msrA/msrB
MMLKWLDIIKRANHGNPKPAKRIEKSDIEWEAILTPEQFRITRAKGTERAHSSDMCQLFEPGTYACICCGTLLFDSASKFESGSGWPSFDQPIVDNVIAYHKDKSLGMYRIEATCNTCDAHLGHVFQDGPPPSGLRFCINAVALKKTERNEQKVTFGGGCFWCTEAIFQEVKGVIKVESGFSGGNTVNPTYREVVSGLTGHAEVVEVTYDNREVSYEDLITIHLTTHNPTTLNRQGADKGSQYRSILFYRTTEEMKVAMEVISEVQKAFDEMIVTEVKMFEAFYKAELYHQDYYASNPDKPYCQAVINPKLKKFRELHKSKIK